MLSYTIFQKKGRICHYLKVNTSVCKDIILLSTQLQRNHFFRPFFLGSISTCNLSGPIGIAEITGDVAQQGVFPFFSLLASISLALAIFNLLPIPPFDGFHMAFTASNWILGGRVPYQVMNLSLIHI